MTAQRQFHTLFTEQEYWYLEEGSITRHEYFQGEVFAMTAASPRHNDIALAIASSFTANG